jgi:hypothetical protein
LKCKDQVLTTLFEVVNPAGLSVAPKQVEPGGKVTLRVQCPPGTGAKTAKSPGFASDIEIGYVHAGIIGQGDGKATTKPGKYTATVICDGKPLTAMFTVAKDKPAPQVSVKPKGAPQTGGGFLAG